MDYEMLDHAELGPSGWKRWSTCTASVHASRGVIEKSSEYADKGNLGHDLGERQLNIWLAANGYVAKHGKKLLSYIRKLECEIEELKEKPLYDAQLQKIVDDYVDWSVAMIKRNKPEEVLVERRFYLNPEIPESFGTSDLVMIIRKKNGRYRLFVADLKTGSGVPEFAQENGQLRLYAVGAWREYQFSYDFEDVEIWIAQPVFGEEGFTTELITLRALLLWFKKQIPKAQEAFEGPGEFVPSVEACRFCKLRFTCDHRRFSNMPVEFFPKKKAEDLAPAELSEELKRADSVIKWYKDLKQYALDTALKGTFWPGHKLVAGRANRFVKDKPKLLRKLRSHGFLDDEIMKQDLVGITQLEAVLGTGQFKALVEPYLDKASPKPVLVPSEDKRAELNNPSDVFSRKSENA